MREDCQRRNRGLRYKRMRGLEPGKGEKPKIRMPPRIAREQGKGPIRSKPASATKKQKREGKENEKPARQQKKKRKKIRREVPGPGKRKKTRGGRKS